VRRRAETLAELAVVILAVHRPHPVRVAIDGCSAAGKTAYPRDSPESYYLDSWDNAAIRDRLLIPLGPDGDRRFQAGIMDLRAQAALNMPVQVAPGDAVLLADGAFLQRPELDPYWDLRVYVDVSFGEVLRRVWPSTFGTRLMTSSSSRPARMLC
jgi:uridine kinase